MSLFYHAFLKVFVDFSFLVWRIFVLCYNLLGRKNNLLIFWSNLYYPQKKEILSNEKLNDEKIRKQLIFSYNKNKQIILLYYNKIISPNHTFIIDQPSIKELWFNYNMINTPCQTIA